MEQEHSEDKQTGGCSQAVIVWPRGIMAPAVLYPLGSTAEETAAIERLLKNLLKRERKS